MFDRILVAFGDKDLSPEDASPVFDALHRLKLHSKTMVTLAHVIAVGPQSLDASADRPSVNPHVDSIRQIEKQLKVFQAQLSCESELDVVSGDPSEEILRLARIHQADLIVLGSRGLTGVNRILQSSVGSQVVNDACCSVMVIKRNLG